MKRMLYTLICLFVLHGTTAHAALTINVNESGGDVVASASGMLNVDALSAGFAAAVFDGYVVGLNGISVIVVGEPPASGFWDVYSLGSETLAFMVDGSPFAESDLSAGTQVGINSGAGGTSLYIPQGYQSGTPVTSSSTWQSTTVAALGLVPGTYVFNWGADGTADSLTIQITAGPQATYTVGGNVSGLSGAGLELQNNGGDTLAIASDGPFTFATELNDGANYAVTVSAQPSGQTCTVSNDEGTINGVDITNVAVICEDDPVASYTVGGTVAGLSGVVTLTNNGVDDLVLNANGVFEFATALDNLSDYLVAVSVQPLGQTCTVNNGEGTISGADITDVAVDCESVLPPPPIQPEPTSVPTDSPWALVLLTTSLMLFGGLILTRQR
jgi:hypothetical protein